MTPAQKRDAQDLIEAQKLLAVAQQLREQILACKKHGLRVNVRTDVFWSQKYMGHVTVMREFKNKIVTIMDEKLERAE